MNFYKRHIGDYLKDTAHLSLLEHGVYTRLLDVYYTRESGIPDEQAARLVGARSRDESAALKVVLGEFFELIDGTWIQDRCEREIHATGTKDESGEKAPAKSGKARRQQEYRERRAQLFEALRERGVTMPFKATMDELQDALLRVTKPSPVTPPVTGGVMPSVTDDEHNVTATNSQTPDATSQTPDFKTQGLRADVVAEPPATVRPAELSAAMRRNSIESQPGDPRVIAAAAAGVTVETIEAACAEAKSSDPSGRIKPGFVLAIATRWTADAAKPPQQRSRASPQQRSYHDDRADTIAGLTGRSRSNEPDDRTIDVLATRVG